MNYICNNDLWTERKNITTVLGAIEGPADYGRGSLIDFNRIIPMPEQLDIVERGVPEDRAMAIAANDFEMVDDTWAKGNSITTIEELCAFLKTKKGGRYDIEELKRIGNIHLSNIVKYGFSDGQGWRMENWGTCLNAENARVIHDGARNCGIRFTTYWDPPIKIVMALGRQFPSNTFTLRYYEMGEGFEGCLKVRGERVLEESFIQHCRWWKENQVVEARM